MIVVFKNILGEVPIHIDSQGEVREQFTSYLASGSPFGCRATIMGFGHVKSDVTAYLNFNAIAFIVDSGGIYSSP